MTKPTTPKNQNTGKGSISNGITGNRVTADVRAWDPQRDYVDLQTIIAAKQQAAKLFVVLSKGSRVHRLNVDKYIAGFRNNLSLHSIVSTLEALYDLPVDRCYVDIFDAEGSTKVKVFYFSPEVLEALGDLFKREAIAEDFRRYRENRYLAKTTKCFTRLLTIIGEYPKLAELHPEQARSLSEVKARLVELESDGVLKQVAHDTH